MATGAHRSTDDLDQDRSGDENSGGHRDARLMTMHTRNSSSPIDHLPSRKTLSRPLVLVAAGLAVAGMAIGLFTYLDRSDIREEHSAGTAAWWPHIVLAVIALVWLVLARIRHARRRPGTPLLLAPAGLTAARRLHLTARTALHKPSAAARLAGAIIPIAVLLYGCFRVGMQVTAGLDPNFTVDAWGGPTYLGAMACHYLDGGLMMTSAAVVLNAILLPLSAPEPRPAVGDLR